MQNKIIAIKILAIPAMKYNFNVVNWMFTEIKKIDTKI